MTTRPATAGSQLIWAAVAPVALWALVRVFGLETGDRLTPLMWFTPYAAVAALLVAGVAVAMRSWAAAAVAALATVCLMAAVLPRAIGSEAVPAEESYGIAVLSANVYLGRGDVDALVRMVDRHEADVLSVQELTPGFAARLSRAGIERRLPHSVLQPRRRGGGGGLYARRPLTELPGPARFSPEMPRALLSLPEGRRVRLVSVHPLPPNLGADEWAEVLESLPAAGSGAPWVLAGDFNASFDQEEFRELVDRGYRDGGAATGKGLEPTWPGSVKFPWRLMTIDHILADRRLGIADFGVEDLPGSDHRAVHAQLLLP